MNYKVLFIGGSHDGERRVIPKLVERIEMAVPSDLSILPNRCFPLSDEGEMPLECRSEIYVKEIISCNATGCHQDEVFFLYRDSKITIWEMINKLIEGYRPKPEV